MKRFLHAELIFISWIFFGLSIFISIIHFVFKELSIVATNNINGDFVDRLVIYTLIFSTLGIALSLFNGVYVDIRKITLKKRILYGFIGIFFGFYVSQMSIMNYIPEIIAQILFIVLLVVLTPYLVVYLSTIKDVFQKIYTIRYARTIKEINPIRQTINLVAVLFLISVIVMLPEYITQKKNKVAQSFYIYEISPSVTTNAEEIQIEGYNLGWKNNDEYKILTDDGELISKQWQDRLIIAEIPLHITEGQKKIFIQKPDPDTNDSIVRSNDMSILVLKRESFYPVENEALYGRIFKKLWRTFFLK